MFLPAEFIAAYSGVLADAIRFAWNGKHGKDFADPNAAFRKQIFGEILANPAAAPHQLVRDVFAAETDYARQAWGIDRRIGQLAELLLAHGDADSIALYLSGSRGGMDNYLGCASARFTDEQLRTFAKTCFDQASLASSDDKRDFWLSGQELFLRRVHS